MSILIKSDQLNYLIYKYLQEAGLNHTAFSFYNQTSLESTITQFKYNTEAGQLINILQKGLILTQIQCHIVLDDFHQCKVPFNLIRQHHCKIVQKVKQLKDKTEEELKKQIEDSIQRTNDVIKAIPNPEPAKPDIESKQRNFLDELYKLKFKCQLQDVFYCADTEILSISQKQENKITFLKYNREDQIFEVDRIIPAYFANSFKPVTIHSHNSRYIILIFSGNNVLLLETRTYSILKMFQLTVTSTKIRKIHWHPKEDYIVTLEFENTIRIFNLQQLAVITTLYGKLFEWKYADQFVFFNGMHIEHKTLSGNMLKNFKAEDVIDELNMSKDKDFILTICYQTNTVRMYTFLSEDPLFIFRQRQPIKFAKFAVSKNATYILILTENGMKVWDVELHQLKQQLVQEENFSSVSVVNLNDKAYSILLAEQSLILHDISSNRKVTRGLIRHQDDESGMFHLKEISEQDSVLLSNSSIYIINKKVMQQVF